MAQTHTRRVHTTMELDEWQIRHHTHKSVAQQELSLSPSAHTTMHARNLHLRANSPFKFSLERQRQSKKMWLVKWICLSAGRRREKFGRFGVFGIGQTAAGRFHLQLQSLVCVNHHHHPPHPLA